MELPHWTVYQRRLRQPLAERTWQGLAAWPRLQLMAGLIVLPLLGLLMKATLLLGGGDLSASLTAWYAGAVGGLGCVWGYCAGAAQMQLVWTNPGPLPVQRGEAAPGPEWYDSQLSDEAALSGILLSSALAALPALLGGALAQWILYGGAPLDLAGQQAQLMMLAGPLDLSRLPHFLLATGCLILAFRTTRARQVLPLLAGLLAALQWVMGCALHAYEPLKADSALASLLVVSLFYHPTGFSPTAPLLWRIESPLWLGVPVLILLLWFGLRDAAARRIQAGATRLLVAIFLAGPQLATIASGALGLAGRAEGPRAFAILSYAQAAAYAASALAVMPGAWLQLTDLYKPEHRLQFLVADQPLAAALAVVCWLLAGIFWWELGLKTLHDVRSNA